MILSYELTLPQRIYLHLGLSHLFVEQKRRWLKIKSLRKQILESFVNLVIAYAKAYHCQAIAIEKLRFKESSKWKNRKALMRFTQWFYARFSKRLEEKAKIYGLRVIKVNPGNISKVCAKYGNVGELEGLIFKCSCGSYNFPSCLVRMEGSALLTTIGLLKLLAWLKVVHPSYLKPQKLLKMIYSAKYG